MKCFRYLTLTLLIGMTWTPFVASSVPADQKPSPSLSSPAASKQVAELVLSKECFEIEKTGSTELRVALKDDGEPDFTRMRVSGMTAIKLINPKPPGCQISYDIVKEGK